MRHYGDSENTEIKTTKSRDVKTTLRHKLAQDYTMETILIVRLKPEKICDEWIDLTTIPHPEFLICEIQNIIKLKSRIKTHTPESRV